MGNPPDHGQKQKLYLRPRQRGNGFAKKRVDTQPQQQPCAAGAVDSSNASKLNQARPEHGEPEQRMELFPLPAPRLAAVSSFRPAGIVIFWNTGHS